jgi:excisionase family DNA binding protein
MKTAVPVAEPRLLDVRGAAQYLSTTVWCVRSLVWGKRLPVIRLGKKLLFDRQDLDKFVDSLKERAA